VSTIPAKTRTILKQQARMRKIRKQLDNHLLRSMGIQAPEPRGLRKNTVQTQPGTVEFLEEILL